MTLQTMLLALALVNIIGPTAGIKYSRCQVVTLLRNNGINTNIPYCKYSNFLKILT